MATITLYQYELTDKAKRNLARAKNSEYGKHRHDNAQVVIARFWKYVTHVQKQALKGGSLKPAGMVLLSKPKEMEIPVKLLAGYKRGNAIPDISFVAKSGRVFSSNSNN